MGMKYIRKKRVLETLIDDNPDLKNKPAQALVDAYERSLSQEEPETTPLKKDRLYAFDQSLDDDYYPDPD
ncbi:hypothetical protein UFOVP1597_34 [uncultured Caudovirales phage]|uniref:Uncharacterized protein n=1 Tax=uncultured Caudovirales phage TaxID=2100421 RepID=A0A6J5SW88_9CAUD|nr:hypothetical protein UFOVP1597_34 [uncultured Caudovirales phage]